MAVNVHFASQDLQSWYEGYGSLPQQPENVQLLDQFRDALEIGAGADRTKMQDVIRNFDQRLLAFEGVTITDTGKVNDKEFPFDRVALKREFMDELFSTLLRMGYGIDFGAKNTNEPASYIYFYLGSWRIWDQHVGNPINNSLSPNKLFDQYRYDKTIYKLDDEDRFTYINLFGATVPIDILEQYKNSFGSLRSYLVKVMDPIEVDNWDTLYTYDVDTGVEIDKRKDYLGDAGEDIFDRYSELIDRIFATGDAIQNEALDIPEIVTSTVGVEIATVDGTGALSGETKILTGLRTVGDGNGGYRHYIFDQTPGGEGGYDPSLDPEETARQQVVKTPKYNSNGDQVQDFSLGYRPNTLRNIVYYEVEKQIVDGHERFVQVNVGSRDFRAETHHLSATEYLYYWNEVRIRMLRGQMLYRQAVVTEVQEDLRQANEALAALEKRAAEADPGSGDTYNTDRSYETADLDYFEANVSTAGKNMFGNLFDNYNNSEWQSNRVSLKAYIDRRTSDAQTATLDYQQVLNRFNNAYEVMAKLQEKLDGLIKTQLRNL